MVSEIMKVPQCDSSLGEVTKPTALPDQDGQGPESDDGYRLGATVNAPRSWADTERPVRYGHRPHGHHLVLDTSELIEVRDPPTVGSDLLGVHERSRLGHETCVPGPVDELDGPERERERHQPEELPKRAMAQRPQLDLDRRSTVVGSHERRLGGIDPARAYSR